MMKLKSNVIVDTLKVASSGGRLRLRWAPATVLLICSAFENYNNLNLKKNDKNLGSLQSLLMFL